MKLGPRVAVICQACWKAYRSPNVVRAILREDGSIDYLRCRYGCEVPILPGELEVLDTPAGELW